MFILGLATEAPPHRYTQSECWDALREAELFHKLDSRNRNLMQRVLNGNSGIDTRHLAIEHLQQAFELSPDVLHRRFETHAPRLAASAAAKALERASVLPSEVDALLVSTCTGYLCPGLTSYVSEILNLKPDALLLDLVGQGCGAAVPNLATADALIASGRYRTVVSICVEICSAAFFFDNDPGVLISACLFGDGAGAVVLGPEASRQPRRVEWKMSSCSVKPAGRDLLRFEQRNGMLRNILTSQVPALASQNAGEVLQRSIAGRSIGREEVTGWVFHPGGRTVLDAISSDLGLPESELRWSRRILRDFGNVSSPSVLFVLEASLSDSVPPGYWWLSAFGAGFSCHGALLEVS